MDFFSAKFPSFEILLFKYSCYKRLETKCYITSYFGDETNGARRKYYSITQLGIQQLQEMAGIWKEIFQILLSVYETVKTD